MKELNHINYLFVKKNFTADQIYVYLSCKSLKEGALPTFSLPRPSANATNNRSTMLLKKEKNIHFYKHSYHSHNHQMFINPLMNLSYV